MIHTIKLFFLVCFMVVPSPSTAQDGGEDANKFYEELIRQPIVPQRETETIQAELNTAKNQLEEADKAIADTNTRVQEADGWISTQKKEINALKPKIDDAKKEKRETDKLALEAQKKQLELVADYLKKTKDVRNSELDLAKSRKDLLTARIKVYEAELNLRQKGDALRGASPSDPNISALALEATQAAENALSLMKTMAEKSANVSDRMTKVAERRVALIQARNKLVTEDRIRKALEQEREK